MNIAHKELQVGHYLPQLALQLAIFTLFSPWLIQSSLRHDFPKKPSGSPSLKAKLKPISVGQVQRVSRDNYMKQKMSVQLRWRAPQQIHVYYKSQRSRG